MRARKDFRQGIKFNINNAAAYLMLAKIYAIKKKYVKRNQNNKKAINILKSFLESALIKSKLNKFQDAQNDCIKGLDIYEQCFHIYEDKNIYNQLFDLKLNLTKIIKSLMYKQLDLYL